MAYKRNKELRVAKRILMSNKTIQKQQVQELTEQAWGRICTTLAQDKYNTFIPKL
jgi:hypothetical protein